MSAADLDAGLVPDRSCEGCTLCCKLMNVGALNKPRLMLCAHCEVGAGCRIYAERPDECARYHCLYRVSPELGEEWRPTASNMVLDYEPRLKRLNISIDGAPQETWRREPYYPQIKIMALHMLRQQGHLLVWEGKDAIAVLPDQDIWVGPLTTATISVRERISGDGEEFDMTLVEPDAAWSPLILRARAVREG